MSTTVFIRRQSSVEQAEEGEQSMAIIDGAKKND
jgi:hypothetical protein